MQYDEILVKIFTTKTGNINSNLIRKLDRYPNIYNYFMNRFEYVESIAESYNRIKNHIEVRPVCPICGGQLVYYKGITYSKTCSSACGKKLGNKTYFDKTGLTTPMKRQDVRDKVRQFYKDNPDKLKNQIEKFNNTCQEKYGVSAPAKVQQVKEKYKQTCLDRYGVDNYAKSEECKEKYKETCLEKYGVESTWKLDKVLKLNHKEMIDKAIETKRKNNTLNKSKPEDNYYEYLCSIYPEVIRQYKCDRYPFNCDFYIPSEDLFIEYQGSWLHGGHPFDCNNLEDLNKLKSWESKNTDFYRNAITTWTVRDVNKRNVAKQNNLNYLEVWN